MTYLAILILSLYIFDPFQRLNGGLWAVVSKLVAGGSKVTYPRRALNERLHPVASSESTYTKPEESLLSKTKIHYEEWL